MKLIPGILIFSLMMSLWSCDYYIVNPHREEIGYIKASEARDKGFEFCYQEKIFPYYYARNPAKFSFGKDSLKKYFKENYSNFGDTSSSGYITIRFGINCKGEAGRYVIQETGTDFQEKKLNSKIVDNLYSTLRNLQDWEPITFYDDRYDSFIHITFKIQNGELLEILP